MNLLDGYGMDTITMAGTLEAKLAARSLSIFFSSQELVLSTGLRIRIHFLRI